MKTGSKIQTMFTRVKDLLLDKSVAVAALHYIIGYLAPDHHSQAILQVPVLQSVALG